MAEGAGESTGVGGGQRAVAGEAGANTEHKRG